MGKRCFRLDLFLVEGATLDGALSGKGEKTLLLIGIFLGGELKCNLRVELVQGWIGKGCGTQDLLLGGVAKIEMASGACPGRGGKALL